MARTRTFAIVAMGYWTGGRRFAGKWIDSKYVGVNEDGAFLTDTPEFVWTTSDLQTAKRALSRAKRREDLRGQVLAIGDADELGRLGSPSC